MSLEDALRIENAKAVAAPLSALLSLTLITANITAEREHIERANAVSNMGAARRARGAIRNTTMSLQDMADTLRLRPHLYCAFS